MEKKKLLILTSTYPRYQFDTIPSFVSDLAMRLTDRFDIFVLCPHTDKSLQFEIFNNCKIYRYRYAPRKFERLAYGGGMLSNLKQQPLLIFIIPFFFMSQLWNAFILCKKYNIKTVHAHWIVPQGVVAWLLKILGVITGYVVTSHGSDLLDIQGGFFYFIKKIILSKASHITVVSSVMKEICLQLNIDKHRISLIPMGVDLNKIFVPKIKYCYLCDVIFVGRLVEKKGAQYLVKAWERVIKLYPQAQLIIIGEGPERKHLEDLADSLDIRSNIRFLGAMPNLNIPYYYQRSKIAIMPTEQEGFGLVAVEAIGCGCQLVASNLPAIRDIVKDGINGRLVPPRDVNAIASAIIEYLSGSFCLAQDEIHRHTGMKKRFDWEIIANKYKMVIDSHLFKK